MVREPSDLVLNLRAHAVQELTIPRVQAARLPQTFRLLASEQCDPDLSAIDNYLVGAYELALLPDHDPELVRDVVKVIALVDPATPARRRPSSGQEGLS